MILREMIAIIFSSSFSILTLFQLLGLSSSSFRSILPLPFVFLLLILRLSICLLALLKHFSWLQFMRQLCIQLRIYKRVDLINLIHHLLRHLLIQRCLPHLHLQLLRLRQFYVISFQDGSTYLQLFLFQLR